MLRSARAGEHVQVHAHACSWQHLQSSPSPLEAATSCDWPEGLGMDQMPCMETLGSLPMPQWVVELFVHAAGSRKARVEKQLNCAPLAPR